MTAQDLINVTLGDVGVLSPGEAVSSDDYAYCLSKLNLLIAGFSAQALPIPTITRNAIALTGAASYTLAGAARPVKIKAASVLTTVAVDMPLLVADAAMWSAYQDKGGTADFGELLYYEHGFPLGKLHIAPLATGTLQLLSQKPAGSGLIDVRETLVLTGAASYTIGAGGAFNVERPLKIQAASILKASSVTKPVRLVSAEEWVAYPKKGVAGLFAEVGYYDAAYPDGTLWLGPKPTAGGTLELFNYIPLAALATLATVIALPPGYERMLANALGVEVAGAFGKPITQAMVGLAEDAKLSILGLNKAVLGAPMGVEPQPQVVAAPPQPQEQPPPGR